MKLNSFREVRTAAVPVMGRDGNKGTNTFGDWRQRNGRVTRMSLLLLLCHQVVPFVAGAATVWTGSRVTSSNTDGPDHITARVVLTRDAFHGLYNSALESAFTHFLSPQDTEWASGTTPNYATLSYTDWNTWAKLQNGGPPSTVGKDAVVHLKTDDIYIDIKFLSWSAGGTYSYQRSTAAAPANSPPTVSITNPSNNTSLTSPAQVTLMATANDSDGSVTNVQFFDGAKSLGNVSSPPYNLVVNLNAGSHTLTAVARDNLGAFTTSAVVNVSVTVPNRNPVLANPISDPSPVAYGAAFNFQVPDNTFTDPDGDSLSYAASGMPPGISFSSASRTFSGTLTQTGVFPVTVTVDDGGSPNLTAADTFTITVTQAVLLVTANSTNKTYGAAEPPFTAAYSGFVNGDTPAVLSGTIGFTRAPGENVGTHAITPGGLTNANYAITFNTGNLTITPAALSVTAEGKTKIYGAPDPAFTAAYSGFVNSDTPAVLGGALNFSRASGENVGSYVITPSGLTSSNYNITFNTGNLTITPAALSVTAEGKTKIYGAPDPAFTAAYSGFVNSDTPAVLGGALNFSRASGENIGSYAITPSGLTSSNYNITFSAGNLTITAAALSVTAEGKTKIYGAPDPAFTAAYSGFVNSETAAVLGGTLSFSRASGENIGSYAITPSGLTSSNYNITFSAGNLTITAAALSVTAEGKTKTYGAPDPAFTATYSGFVNSETAAVLGGTLSFSRAPGENVGSYAITPSSLTSSNYNIAFNTGTLSITPAPLSVTADDKTKTVGASDPVFTATYSGFVNGDTSASLGGSLSFSRAAGEAVGSYAITPAGLTSTNYAITFVPGTLTIAAPTASPTLSLRTANSTNLVLNWDAVSNVTYRVQFKGDLSGTNWADLPGDVLAGGSTASKTDTLTPTNRFYRVQVLP